MTLREELDARGFAIVPQLVSRDLVAGLREALASIDPAEAVRARDQRVYAVRNLMDVVPAVRRLCARAEMRSTVSAILGDGALPVRAILFDKTPAANWKVAWHQDLSIAVRERIEVPGFGPWSVKAGVVHVQPPVEVLRRMVTVRLHLDDCGEDNGALRVIPGSHERVLSPDEVASCSARVAPVPCVVAAGGAVVMRPLILHASSSATVSGHRRVIHVEWSADALPGGLAWSERERA